MKQLAPFYYRRIREERWVFPVFPVFLRTLRDALFVQLDWIPAEYPQGEGVMQSRWQFGFNYVIHIGIGVIVIFTPLVPAYAFPVSSPYCRANT